MGYKPISSLESTPVSINERVENIEKMFEIVFDQKRDVARLSHKKMIRIQRNEKRIDLKELVGQ